MKKKRRKCRSTIIVLALSSLLISSLNPVLSQAKSFNQDKKYEENRKEKRWLANTSSQVKEEMKKQASNKDGLYTIRWGDSLWAISLATGISIEDLAKVNDIPNPNLIIEGWIIQIDPKKVADMLDKSQVFDRNEENIDRSGKNRLLLNKEKDSKTHNLFSDRKPSGQRTEIRRSKVQKKRILEADSSRNEQVAASGQEGLADSIKSSKKTQPSETNIASSQTSQENLSPQAMPSVPLPKDQPGMEGSISQTTETIGQSGGQDPTITDSSQEGEVGAGDEEASVKPSPLVEIKLRTEKTVLNPGIKYVENAQLPQGQQRILQAGSSGLRITVYKETYQDGHLISSSIQTQTETPALDEIVEVGTYIQHTDENSAINHSETDMDSSGGNHRDSTDDPSTDERPEDSHSIEGQASGQIDPDESDFPVVSTENQPDEKKTEAGTVEQGDQEVSLEDEPKKEEDAANSSDDLAKVDEGKIGEDEEKIQYVEIPDPKLLKVINKNLGLDRKDDQKVTVEEMASLTALSTYLYSNGKPHFSVNVDEDETVFEEGNVGEKHILGDPKNLSGTKDYKFALSYGIKSLVGLEYAKNLKKIKLNENEIESLEPLRHLKMLEYLELQRNRIKDLSPLADLKNLKYLKLYNNKIIDVTPLRALTNLKGLDLHYNVILEGNENNKIIVDGLKDISSLKDLRELEYLDISANIIEDLSPIQNMIKLKDLDVSSNRIRNFTGTGGVLGTLSMQADRGEGSVNYGGQQVKVDEKAEAHGEIFQLNNPYMGLDSLMEALALPADYLFLFIQSSLDGIQASYHSETDCFHFILSEDLLKEKAGQTLTFNLSIYGGVAMPLPSQLSDIHLDVPELSKKLVTDQYFDFYKNLFNHYNGFEKKYSHLTDEANQRFTEQTPPITDRITAEDMKMLKVFKVTDQSVTDEMLAPLKEAENLEVFIVSLNDAKLKRQVTNFDILKDKKKLQVFYYQNQGHMQGETLGEAINIQALSDLTSLKDLRIDNTDLDDLTPLAKLDLKSLCLPQNKIHSIESLQAMKNLQRLDLEKNQITDLTPLADMDQLITLYLYSNPINDITVLASLDKLEALHLRDTKIDNIVPLKDMDHIHRLYIDQNDLKDGYIQTILAMKGLNVIFLPKIHLEEFKALQDFMLRPAVEATFGEDQVRMLTFDELIVPMTFSKDEIKNDGKLIFSNPLRDKNGQAVGLDPYAYGENKDQYALDRLNFVEDQIEWLLQEDDLFPMRQSYPIYLEDPDMVYGEYEQPASIAGKIVLEVTLEDVAKQDEEIEGYYDSRELGHTTSVKNQFRDGSCRSFASLAALETYIKRFYGEEVDLSENNVEMRHKFTYNGKFQPRAGRSRNSDLPYLINGQGPIFESEDPYIPMQDSQGQPSEFLTKLQLDRLPIVEDKEPVYLVTGVDFLKTVDVASVQAADDPKLQQVKDAVKAYGAVVTDIYISHDGRSTFPYSNKKTFQEKTAAYYFDGNDASYQSGMANHAVTIVGYNDYFSKDNFVVKPSIDGAWIVKDAQGSEFGDQGYYYVSYQSLGMLQNPYAFSRVDLARSYDGIFQHDDLALTSFMRWDFYEDGSPTILFNKHEAKENVTMTKIGFYTTRPNATYSVYFVPHFDILEEVGEEVSDDWGSVADFNSKLEERVQKGEIVKLSGTMEKAGYHVLDIPKIKLESGQIFALGISVKNDDAEDPNHQWDMVLEKNDGSINSEGRLASVNKYETYVFAFDTWMDGNQFATKGISSLGNVAVKGYFIKG